MSLLQAAYDSAKEKIINSFKNPFLGTYITYWCIHNWRIFYILLSEDESFKLKERVNTITNWYLHPWDILWLPLIVATVVTIIYPFFSLVVNLYYSVANKEEEKLIKNFTQDGILTEVEAEKIKKEKSDLEIELRRVKSVVREVAVKRSIPNGELHNAFLGDYETDLPVNVMFVKNELLTSTERDIIFEYSRIKESYFFGQFKLFVVHSQFEGQTLAKIESLEKMRFLKLGLINIDKATNSFTFTERGEAIMNLFLHDYK